MTFNPDWVVAPGETLREWRDWAHLPAKAAAKACGRMPVELYLGIEAGAEPITEDIAARLYAGTGIFTKFWLNLEKRYRDGLAAGKKTFG